MNSSATFSLIFNEIQTIKRETSKGFSANGYKALLFVCFILVNFLLYGRIVFDLPKEGVRKKKEGGSSIGQKRINTVV